MKTTTLTVSPLRAFRLQHLQMSLDEVSAALGIHKATYSRIELGETVPSKQTLRAILDYFASYKAGITAEHVIFPEEHMVKLKLSNA